VSSTLDALGRLSLHHRQRWGGLVVAVGGSAGKTTTRAALAAALELVAPGAVHASVGNLNNRIGVPLVLLGVRPEHRVAVLEIGTNLRGEVRALAAATAPDVAVLTAIGIEHAGGIGDLDAIEAEEGDLLQALGRAGIAVAYGDDERCARQLERCQASTRLAYGTSAVAHYRLVERRALGLGGSRLTIDRPNADRLELDVPLLGLPGALSILAACAVADRLAAAPLDSQRLQAAFAAARFESGRLVPIELEDGTVLLDDSYNSNPLSLRSSIGVAREIGRQRGARLVLVLGEMRELGAVSASEHQTIGRELAGSGAAALIGVAGDAELLVLAAHAGGLAAVFAADAARAAELARERVQPGDVVLVKGSRGIGLEQVVEQLGGRAR
jgi:UDP-N-acetylmuramoyl-tripeptide--D-alanyl-D-alanine ligase